jgi:aryl-alcohol dehydrogenase-like predicted oxidoreductase
VEVRNLGNTGISVSTLCYGALPIGPLQADMPLREGAALIGYCLDRGVNFIDTAQVYKTYPYIREALRERRGTVVIATKAQAADYRGMREAIEQAAAEMGVERIDIMYLHAARVTPGVFVERREAIRCLCDAKAEGLIRAVGVSTHSVEVVRAAAEMAEIDVIMPVVNIEGTGIVSGDLDDMVSAIERAAGNGKGVVAQKALAGGHLIDRFREALEFVLRLPVSSVAVGMLSRHEVDADIAVFEGRQVPEETLSRIGKVNKSLRVQRFCKGCGTCERVCPNSAIKVFGGTAVVDGAKCILCGYCCPVCPEFALRLA